MMDSFIYIVEARINRLLDIREMAQRAEMLIVDDSKEYYGLPRCFSGIRSIEVKNPAIPDVRNVARYLSNELMNAHIVSGSREFKYTIQADQFHIYPPPATDCIIEIIYYGDLIHLDGINQSNFMSKTYPDIYVFGLLVEISSYTKDLDAAAGWEQRFMGAISDLKLADQVDRWSGTSLEMKVVR